MTSSAWSWTLLFLFLAGLPLFHSFPQPTSAPIADSPSFPFWLMFSFLVLFFLTCCFLLFQMFVNMVCAHLVCGQGATVYISVPTSCSSSLSLSISSSRQFRPLHQRLLRLLLLVPRQVSSTCSFILSYLHSPLDHHL